MEPIITVIIPVYNAGKYFESCLHSILCQTEQNFELIIIDDGSTDNSLSIAKVLLASRPLTRIVSQSNSGVSSARNHGIELATGKYITFVDSDDIINPDYIQQFQASVCEFDYDYVMAGISFVAQGQIIDSVDYDDEILTIEEIRSSKFSSFDGATRPVGILYKRQIIRSNSLRFDSCMSYGEDRNFNIEYLSNIENFRHIPYNGYMYITEVEGSLSKKYYEYAFMNDLIYWNKLRNVLCTEVRNDELNIHLSERLFFFIIDNISEDLKHIDYKQEIKRVLEIIPLIGWDLLKAYSSKMRVPKWQLQLLLFSPRLLCYVLSLISKKK